MATVAAMKAAGAVTWAEAGRAMAEWVVVGTVEPRVAAAEAATVAAMKAVGAVTWAEAVAAGPTHRACRWSDLCRRGCTGAGSAPAR